MDPTRIAAAIIVFYCDGIRGTIDRYGYVLWAGRGFDISAARGALAKAIARAMTA